MKLRIFAIFAAAAVVAGCATGTPPAPATPTVGLPGAAAAPATVPGPGAVGTPVATGGPVMIIRHGEKPEDDDEVGIDADGNEDDSSMTETGWSRAHRLVDLFAPTGGAIRPGLARPTAIFAAGPNDEGEGKRTRETVAPLAERLGIAVDFRLGKGDEKELVERVLTEPGPTLISWQHSGIPAIAAAFPGVTPTPPDEWPDDRFDLVWILTPTANGWHFTQLPELALPQDRPDVIED